MAAQSSKFDDISWDVASNVEHLLTKVGKILTDNLQYKEQHHCAIYCATHYLIDGVVVGCGRIKCVCILYSIALPKDKTVSSYIGPDHRGCSFPAS